MVHVSLQSFPKALPLLFLKKLINWLIYFWLRWVFVAVCGLSLVAASGGYSLLWCAGFSLRWLLLLWSTGSGRTGFSSCSTACGIFPDQISNPCPCTGRRILNCCATREVLFFFTVILYFLKKSLWIGAFEVGWREVCGEGGYASPEWMVRDLRRRQWIHQRFWRSLRNKVVKWYLRKNSVWYICRMKWSIDVMVGNLVCVLLQ